ncbi:MAG: hypothetical protein P8Z42_09120, partial [Anaerolineales bacterium]
HGVASCHGHPGDVADLAANSRGGIVKLRFHLVSLGCAKNSVDSESMAALLACEGCQAANGVADADVIIVNTCGFIDAAREESLAELQRLSNLKQPGQMLIAAGCLTQRFGAAVAQQVPGIWRRGRSARTGHRCNDWKPALDVHSSSSLSDAESKDTPNLLLSP